jgi:hypothetical protein
MAMYRKDLPPLRQWIPLSGLFWLLVAAWRELNRGFCLDNSVKKVVEALALHLRHHKVIPFLPAMLNKALCNASFKESFLGLVWMWIGSSSSRGLGVL